MTLFREEAIIGTSSADTIDTFRIIFYFDVRTFTGVKIPLILPECETVFYYR